MHVDWIDAYGYLQSLITLPFLSRDGFKKALELLATSNVSYLRAYLLVLGDNDLFDTWEEKYSWVALESAICLIHALS